MGNILYIIAGILIIAWAIGFIGFETGGIIHALLITGIITILIRFFRDEGFFKSYGNSKFDWFRD